MDGKKREQRTVRQCIVAFCIYFKRFAVHSHELAEWKGKRGNHSVPRTIKTKTRKVGRLIQTKELEKSAKRI